MHNSVLLLQDTLVLTLVISISIRLSLFLMVVVDQELAPLGIRSIWSHLSQDTVLCQLREDRKVL